MPSPIINNGGSEWSISLIATKTSLFAVSERMPECHINVSSAVNIADVIKLQCNVNYSGRWPPNFNCVVESYNGQQQRMITLDCKRHVVLLNLLVTTMQLTGPRSSIFGSRYSII